MSNTSNSLIGLWQKLKRCHDDLTTAKRVCEIYCSRKRKRDASPGPTFPYKSHFRRYLRNVQIILEQASDLKGLPQTDTEQPKLSAWARNIVSPQGQVGRWRKISKIDIVESSEQAHEVINALESLRKSTLDLVSHMHVWTKMDIDWRNHISTSINPTEYSEDNDGKSSVIDAVLQGNSLLFHSSEDEGESLDGENMAFLRARFAPTFTHGCEGVSVNYSVKLAARSASYGKLAKSTIVDIFTEDGSGMALAFFNTPQVGTLGPHVLINFMEYCLEASDGLENAAKSNIFRADSDECRAMEMADGTLSELLEILDMSKPGTAANRFLKEWEGRTDSSDSDTVTTGQ